MARSAPTSRCSSSQPGIASPQVNASSGPSASCASTHSPREASPISTTSRPAPSHGAPATRPNAPLANALSTATRPAFGTHRATDRLNYATHSNSRLKTTRVS